MKNLFEGLNEQFNFEISSGYIYLAMSAYCKDRGMDGFAHFFKKQADEEFEHATKFYNFLFDTDNKPVYDTIEKPQEDYKSFLEVFESALEHEKEVTRRITDLYKQAVKEEEYRVTSFLKWFIDEQVEEEDNFRGLIEKIERAGESWAALYMFDSQLAQR